MRKFLSINLALLFMCLQKYEKIMEEKTTLESRYSYLKQQVALAKNVQDQVNTIINSVVITEN